MTLTERLSRLSGPAMVPKKPAEAQDGLTAKLVNLGNLPVTPLDLSADQPQSKLSQRLTGLSNLPLTPQNIPVDPPQERLAARLTSLPQMPPVPQPQPATDGLVKLQDRLLPVLDALSVTTPTPITIPFGPWMPDLPALANPGATVAMNVIPAERSYKPLGSLQAATAALTATCQAGFQARDTTGNYFNYAADASKLYEVRASGVTDKSKSGGYSTASGEVWEFTTYRNTLIATNYADPVQGIAIGGGGLFADQFTSTNVPKARHVATIRDFLVLGNTVDGTDGTLPYRTWWSAFGDPTDMDPAAATQSDFEDRPRGGWVQKVVGGVEYGLIFQQSSITRMTYAGAPAVFQFDSIDRQRGTPIPNSVIGHGRLVYFISEEGFFVTDGTQSIPIGANQVDLTFWNQFDIGNAHLVSSAIDPVNKIVAWAFPGAAGVGKIYFFDWQDRRWSEAEVEVECLANTTSEAFTLEGLDALALDSGADTTLSANEASGQTIISVTSVTGFAAAETVRVTLDSGSIHQTTIASVGASTITLDVALPSAAASGNRFVRTSVESLTLTLDSSQYRGGGFLFGAFDTDHKLAYFDGATLAATIETGELEIFPGRYAMVSKARPLIDGGTITAAVAGRDRYIDAAVYDPSLMLDNIGEVGLRNTSRYHRFRCKVAAGGTWTHAQGVQIQASPMGTQGFD